MTDNANIDVIAANDAMTMSYMILLCVPMTFNGRSVMCGA